MELHVTIRLYHCFSSSNAHQILLHILFMDMAIKLYLILLKYQKNNIAHSQCEFVVIVFHFDSLC